MNITITMSPPTRYSPTFSGDSFSATRPIDLMPRMMTAQTRTAIADAGDPGRHAEHAVEHQAIELGWVKGVVVSAPTPATSANVLASAGDFMPSRR